MRYVLERCKQEGRKKTYRIYVTDALKSIVGAENRYADYVYPVKQDARSSDDIIANIKAKLQKEGGFNG